ncbi:sulfate transporter-like, partial [Mya arenaria]|uniref:sulfate transporter-like n=1 Tax=Mya arenaria TaxID=6604 RepID=UPI0022E682B1
TGDLMSGVSVACLHFPQGLAYGLLASLTPVQGLYTCFFPVLFYSVFGSCQHMAFGTDSVIALVTAEVVETQVKAKFGDMAAKGSLSGNQTVLTKHELMAYKVQIAATCTFVCGGILLIMGILRMGFITRFQSKSFIGGFTTAAAFHIFSSQVPKALGIEVPLVKGIGKVMVLYKLVFERVHLANVASVIIVVICTAFIVFLKDFVNTKYKAKLKVPIPADLLAIIIATVISKLCSLYKFNVEMVGEIPTGVPQPVLPDLSMLGTILPGCIEMSLLIFFLSIAMVKVCSERHEYEVNDNQELLGYGMTNIACGFFPCYPANTSPPRNMILSSMGANTTLNGLFTSGVLLLVLFVLGESEKHHGQVECKVNKDLQNMDNQTEEQAHVHIVDTNNDTRIKVIILDCTCMGYIDSQGISTLSVVFEEYRRVGVTVLLAGCTPFVWAALNRSDFFTVVSKERAFWKVEDAYQAALSLVN